MSIFHKYKYFSSFEGGERFNQMNEKWMKNSVKTSH